MVVVVPAFSKGEEGDQRAVAAVVRGGKMPTPKTMGQGIDGKSCMVQQHGAHTESPDQHLQAGRMPAGNGLLQPGP